MNQTIITIGRQFGSGGREIGKRLAKKLDIPYYDKELLAKAAKDSGLCTDYLEERDERSTNSLLYSFVMGTRCNGYPQPDRSALSGGAGLEGSAGRGGVGGPSGRMRDRGPLRRCDFEGISQFASGLSPGG